MLLHQTKNGREVSRSRRTILAPSVESIMLREPKDVFPSVST